MFPPGLEPGTFRVLDGCDNHYTTETHSRYHTHQREEMRKFWTALSISQNAAPTLNCVDQLTWTDVGTDELLVLKSYPYILNS